MCELNWTSVYLSRSPWSHVTWHISVHHDATSPLLCPPPDWCRVNLSSACHRACCRCWQMVVTSRARGNSDMPLTCWLIDTKYLHSASTYFSYFIYLPILCPYDRDLHQFYVDDKYVNCNRISGFFLTLDAPEVTGMKHKFEPLFLDKWHVSSALQ